MIRLNDILVKVFVLLLAIFQPMIIIYYYGLDLPSVSSAWLTNLQPLFIITNACTSYFLFNDIRWRIPSLFLLLLTAFSVDFSILYHNIFAVSFFISCLYSLYGIRRLRWYILPYLSSIIILLFFGIFLGEVFAIIVICSYHINLLVDLLRIRNKKRDSI